MPATSDPPPGSVTASEPIFSPASVGRTNASICSGVAVRRHVRQRDPAGEQRRRPGPEDPPASKNASCSATESSSVAALPADLLGEGDARAARPSPRRGAATGAPRRRPPTPGGAASTSRRTNSRVGVLQRQLLASSRSSQQLLGNVTSRERSHSPSPLACGSNRVLRGDAVAEQPVDQHVHAGRLGSAKTSTSRSSASGSSSRTRSTVTSCAQPLRALGLPVACAHPQPTLASPPLSPDRACTNVPSGIRRVMALSADAGDRVGGRRLVPWSALGAARRPGGSAIDLGAAVGQVHGVLDGVAVDVRRPVDAVRRRRARAGRSA